MAQTAAFSGTDLEDFGESSSSGITQIRVRPRKTINHVDSSWTQPVSDRLDKLLKLRPNWDGYGAASIKFDTAVFCTKVIETLHRNDLPPPSLVPSTCGGIQIEWHKGDIHIEILVAEPLKSYGWATLGYESGEQEGEFRSDFSIVNDWLNVLADVETAAA